MTATNSNLGMMFEVVVVVYFTVILFQHPAELDNLIIHRGSLGGATCHVRKLLTC
jgi:hypothetical protein